MKKPPLETELATKTNFDRFKDEAIAAAHPVVDEYKKNCPQGINTKLQVSMLLYDLAEHYAAYRFDQVTEPELVQRNRVIKALAGDQAGTVLINRIYQSVDGKIEEKFSAGSKIINNPK